MIYVQLVAESVEFGELIERHGGQRRVRLHCGVVLQRGVAQAQGMVAASDEEARDVRRCIDAHHLGQDLLSGLVDLVARDHGD